MSGIIKFKPSGLKLRKKAVRYIVLHSTDEMYKRPELTIDNDKVQINKVYSSVLEKNGIDINYNYIVEEMGRDFHVVLCRPVSYLCHFKDISPDINHLAIHIALLGSYDLKIPNPRLYDVLSYKLLNPLLFVYKLPSSRVVLHRDISTEKNITCPGYFVERPDVETYIKKYYRR